MHDRSLRFPITKRWPADHPDRLQLYSLPTPNGVKVSIMLEEIGLPYEPYLIDFGKGDQRTPDSCRSILTARFPRSSIPRARGASRCPCSNRGPPFYLAEKTASSCPPTRAPLRDARVAVLPDGGDGPDVRPGRLFPQIRRPGIEDKRPLDYATKPNTFSPFEAARRASLVMGDDYTIADISMSAGCAISSTFTAPAIWSASAN